MSSVLPLLPLRWLATPAGLSSPPVSNQRRHVARIDNGLLNHGQFLGFGLLLGHIAFLSRTAEYASHAKILTGSDVKKIWIDTTVKTTAGAYVSSLDIDPVVWGIGYGFRF